MCAASNGKKAELLEIILGRNVKLTATASETQNTASDEASNMPILYGIQGLGLASLQVFKISRRI